jgi:hypothetical protein
MCFFPVEQKEVGGSMKQLRQPAAGSGRNRSRGRLLGLAIVALIVCSGVFASTAAADKPIVSTTTATSSTVLTDVCSFPITLDSSATIRETDFVDKSGAVTRILAHIVEQDVFRANGKSLTGVPFTFNIDVLFDSSGNVTHVFANGVVEKVPLPGGGLFITAGRVDFVAHGSPPFLIFPDVGATVNLEGFCAALST